MEIGQIVEIDDQLRKRTARHERLFRAASMDHIGVRRFLLGSLELRENPLLQISIMGWVEYVIETYPNETNANLLPDNARAMWETVTEILPQLQPVIDSFQRIKNYPAGPCRWVAGSGFEPVT